MNKQSISRQVIQVKYLRVSFAMTPIGMSVSPPADSPSESTAEILRLKRKLSSAHQKLDEAQGSRPKKIP
jgi:hypothetical protein